MTEFMYRFRGTAALLDDHDELDKQEIYLAAPNELNDPVEGYRDVFWAGDAVLWRNLVRHYISCLVWALPQVPCGSAVPVIQTTVARADYPTPALLAMYDEAATLALDSDSVKAAVSVLPKLGIPVRREALSYFLTALHIQLLRIVVDVFSRSGLSTIKLPSASKDEGTAAAFEALEKALASGKGSESDGALLATFVISNRIAGQIGLMARYNFEDDAKAKGKAGAVFMLLDFPHRYVDAIENDLIHPPWYTACFSDRCDDASMWGSYGQSHTGVALKFRTMLDPKQRPAIQLYGVRGAHSSRGQPDRMIRGDQLHTFFRVDYASKPPPIDFFRFLGRLPIGKVQSVWHNEGGLVSDSVKDVYADTDAWRVQLWDNFHKCVTTKLSDWSHEQEYRLVVPDALGLHQERTDRKERYSFKDLAGIVFGMKTTDADKKRIIQTIEAKCVSEHRSDFEFSQAYYSHQKGKIEVWPLSLLKFQGVAVE